MVIEIPRNQLVQMRTVFSDDIVLVARIDEIIGIGIRVHASLEETEAVLPNNHRVYIAVNQQEAAAQVLSLELQVGILIALGVFFRMIHIAFAVHDFIVAPVDDRAAGDSHFENIRIRTHQVSRHKAAIAPAVHADAVFVDEGLRLQELDTLHLVGHFIDTQVAVDNCLEGMSPVCRTPTIYREYRIAAPCHVNIPTADAAHPRAGYQLGMRTAVNIDDSRVLLRAIHIQRLDEEIVQLRLPIGRRDLASFHFRHIVTGIRVLGFEQRIYDLVALRIGNDNLARNVPRRIGMFVMQSGVP